MIVVDTSALIALALNEPAAGRLGAGVQNADRILMSAATAAEALIVARRRNVGPDVAASFDALGIEIMPVTPEFAKRAADAHDRWGRGVHPAGLNIIDCFAYALAKERDCPLLFVGEDFARTDVKVAA